MARLKIDYGIDLGTTNSAICRMEKGEPVVIKTDVLKDTMPSCVSFTKRQSVKAGDNIVILESMKMEIPVVAPQDGTVASINVAVGDAVENGDTLATLN